MSESLNEASSRDIVSESLRIPAEMRDFLRDRLKIPDETIDAIILDSELLPSIENLMKNPENQNERQIFLGKYIYDRIIAEAKAAGKDPVDYALSKGKSDAFAEGLDKYILKKAAIEDGRRIAGKEQAAIEDGRRIAGKEQAAIERDKMREETRRKIEESTQRGRDSLSDEGKGELDALTKQKKQDPKFQEILKKQGYSEEEIGKMSDATLTNFASGIVLVEQAESFSKKGFIRDAETYKDVVKTISDTLGIERKIPLKDIPLPPGDRRDQVIQSGTELLKTGNYNDKSITYNSRTGRITFEPNSPTIMKAEIDTSRIPPVLEYVRGSLRIGQDIPPVDPRMKEKRGLEERQGKLQEVITKDSAIRFAELGGETYEGLPSKLVENHKAIIDSHKQNQKALQEIMNSGGYSLDPSLAMENIRKIKLSNQDLEQARKSTINMENLSDPSMKALEEGLYAEYDGIQNLERSLGQFAQNTDQLKKYAGITVSNDTEFEEVAKGTLARLDEMGYTILGQRNLDRIMAALTYRRPSIWKNPNLDLKSISDRDLQLRDLQDVASRITAAFPGSPKNSTNAFSEITRRMQSINTGPIMENLWNNPAALSQWLEKIGISSANSQGAGVAEQPSETAPQSI